MRISGCHRLRWIAPNNSGDHKPRSVSPYTGIAFGNAPRNRASIASHNGSHTPLVCPRPTVHATGMVGWCTTTPSASTVQRLPSVVASKARNTSGRRSHATPRRSRIGNRVCWGHGCCRKRLRRCRPVLGAMWVRGARNRHTWVWASVPRVSRVNRSQWRRLRWVGVSACWRCWSRVAIGYSSAALCRLGVIIVGEIDPKRHFFVPDRCTLIRERAGSGGAHAQEFANFDSAIGIRRLLPNPLLLLRKRRRGQEWRE